MAVDVMLHEAVDAIRRGQRARARDLLTRLLRADQKNPQYWLWMSSVVESSNEQIYCLNSVLKADPHNQSARQGLVLLGALPPADDVMPVPPVQRQWPVDIVEIQEVSRVRSLLGNMVVRIVLISIAALLLIGLVGVGFYNWMQPNIERRLAAASRPTRTPLPAVTLTATRTPINYTPTPPTATPTFEGGVPPLWLKLKNTFTPTPMYVATTHITNEAFNTGMAKFDQGDYERALELLEQATRFEPFAPDIHYYIGEVYLALDEYQQAYGAYQRALDIDPDFAPAYLGRARARLSVGPNPNVITDLDTALELDNELIEAYLLRIDYYLAEGDDASALEDLLRFEKLAPNSATAALYRAQLLLAEDEIEGALELAQKANKLDPTLLDTYLVLGWAASELGNYDQALEALEVYLLYKPDDTQALVSFGRALYADEQYDETTEVMQRALDLDDELAEAYYYAGLVLIQDDEGQKAVNQLVLARNLDRASFDYSLALGRALLSANRLAEARDQITAAGRLAQSDDELAQMHYYRALAIEAIGNQPTANLDWEALLELPEKDVPSIWRRIARRRLATPVPTLTLTPTGTLTPEATED